MKTAFLVLTGFCAMASLLASLLAPSDAKAAVFTLRNQRTNVKAEIVIDRPERLKSPQNIPNIHYSLPAKPAEERPESSPSSPPLETDDPGTPGRGGVEINIITDCDFVKDGRSCKEGIDAAFGLGDKAQLRLSKYVVQEKASGSPTFHGVSQLSVGVKYRFYDRNGLQIATFPSYQFDDATRRVDADGQVEPSEGRTVYLPIIVSKEVGQWTVVSNLGYNANLDRAGADSVFASVAAGHAVTKTSRAMAEVATSTSKDGTRADFRIGYVRLIFPNEKSRFEKAFFISAGKSIVSDDGVSHITIRMGMSVGLKPRSH